MANTKVLLSLSTDTNDFQRQQAAVAEETARRLGVNLKVIFADSDPIRQSEELLKVVQSAVGSRPDAIMVQPAGATALPQVARSAVAAGIGWIILNWNADYLGELRAAHRLPIFAFSSDQIAIGRMQGEQLAALLPQGGNVLYIQGPATSPAAQQRTTGLNQTKPHNIQLKTIKSALWNEEGGYRAASSWLRLATAQKEDFDLVVAQSDVIAMGARKAFTDPGLFKDQGRAAKMGFLGIDGLASGGQAWVTRGFLTATIIVPPNAGMALEMLVNVIDKKVHAPECTYTTPTSYPALDALKNARTQKQT
jgi:ribose transport system substrate-binding protein